MTETKVYKSKIGLELVIPLALLLGGTSIIMVIEKVWVGFAINFAIIIFICYTFKNTVYTIKDGQLFVKCGFFVNETIAVDKIKRVSETRNPLSSAAASLDRLEIIYNQYGKVLISPKDKTGFVNHIKSINPGIEVKYRNKKQH